MSAETAYETDRDHIIDRLLDVLPPGLNRRVARVSWRRHSNDVGHVELEGGQDLMVKVARFEWAAAGFRAERLAARLLADRDLLVPQHLDTPERIAGRAVLCYWRIPLETLASAWVRLDADGQASALRTWGEILRRIHEVRTESVGPVGDDRGASVADFLEQDVRERLLPAVAGDWPAGLPALRQALDALPEVRRRTEGRPSVLLHGDPHARNVMCRSNGAAARSAGFIDLESASGGPREMDLAHALVLHGPLFEQPLPSGWFEELRQGYREPLDAFLLDWFAVYHLLNLGFFSAHVGHHEHAEAVARSACRRSGRLASGAAGTASATSHG